MKAIKVTIQSGENFRLANGSPIMHRVGKPTVMFLTDTMNTSDAISKLQHLAIIEEDEYDRQVRMKAHKNNSTIEIRRPKGKKIKTMYGSKRKTKKRSK